MKNVRRGMGKGMGCGYKNIAPMDAHIHSLSAKGVKTYPDMDIEDLNAFVLKRYAKEVKPIVTKGNEKIVITCANCNQKISDFKNIFEGKETSYICPRCGYEGFAFSSNTKLNAKGELQIPIELQHSKLIFKYDKSVLPTTDVLNILKDKMDLKEGRDFDVAFCQTNIKEGIIFLHTDKGVARVVQSNPFKGKVNRTNYNELKKDKVKIFGVGG